MVVNNMNTKEAFEQAAANHIAELWDKPKPPAAVTVFVRVKLNGKEHVFRVYIKPAMTEAEFEALGIKIVQPNAADMEWAAKVIKEQNLSDDAKL